MDTLLQNAQRYSVWLARQLNNHRLNLDILSNWLKRPISQQDFVHFAEIDFPAKVSKVRFTIKDVYNGEKWNDTCITAVITRRD